MYLAKWIKLKPIHFARNSNDFAENVTVDDRFGEIYLIDEISFDQMNVDQ